MRIYIKALLVSSVFLSVATGSASFAGSTLGGVPNNGGGVTFGAPASALTNVIGGQALQDAIAAGNPTQIEAALQNAIVANFPGGTGSVDLDPLPGQTGEQTVALLVSLIQGFAAAVGLPLSSPAIQTLLAIAQTAIA